MSGKMPAQRLFPGVCPGNRNPLEDLHTAEVTGSIPVAPTPRIPCNHRGFLHIGIFNQPLCGVRCPSGVRQRSGSASWDSLGQRPRALGVLPVGGRLNPAMRTLSPEVYDAIPPRRSNGLNHCEWSVPYL